LNHRNLFAIAALVFALPLAAGAAPKKVGGAITVAEATPIADILARPAEHAGKLVRVEGEVSGVCTRMGCWMDIADAAGRRIRIQVEDGVMVFPADSKGNPAVAQGTVTVEEMSREKWVAWHEHVAEEGGPAFDEKAVGAGPFHRVQIAGTGATFGE
jgi:hypothetical protein